MSIRIAVLVSFLIAVLPARAQQTCFTFPPDSPVPAPTIDSVPRAVDQIITYTGTYVNAPANGGMAIVELNGNEQQVFFGVDADPSVRTYYNRRYRADASSPWYWQYANSVLLMDLGATSAGPATVLYSPTGKYRDDGGFTQYKYLMYLVSQPNVCDGSVAGFLYVSYSNNGTCWTKPQLAVRNGGPSFACLPDVGNTVPVEDMAAIDGGGTIYLMGIEGDISLLSSYVYMDRSQTHIATASPDFPRHLTLIGTGEVSNAGIVSPSGVTGSIRYKPYNYFINMDMAFDATTGYLYAARAYPYPFDRYALRTNFGGSHVPCDWQAAEGLLWNAQRGKYSRVKGCYASPAVLPNRTQVYRMYIGSLSNFSQLLTGTWQLMADWGGNVGYTNASLTACNTGPGGAVYTQRNDPSQQDIGRDPAYPTFLRDTAGNLKVTNNQAFMLLGDSFKLSKGFSYCYITGDERVVTMQVPR